MLRNRTDCIHDTVERDSLVRRSPETRFPSLENNLCTYIFYFLNENEPAGLGKILIDGTHASPKNAEHWNAQGRCFAIHCSPAADDEVRIPDQIQTVHGVFRNDDAPLFDRLRPAGSENRRL